MLYYFVDLSRWHLILNFIQSLNPVLSIKLFSIILYKKGGVICCSWQRLYSFLTVCNFQTFFIKLATGVKKNSHEREQEHEYEHEQRKHAYHEHVQSKYYFQQYAKEK